MRRIIVNRFQQEKELVVHFDKERAKLLLITSVVVFAAAIVYLFMVKDIPYSRGVIMYLCFLAGAFILLVPIYVAFFLKILLSKKPAAVINNDGCWHISFGLIPWKNIDRIEHCVSENNIVIHLKNKKGLFRNAHWDGRIKFLFSKFASYPPVTLEEIAIDKDLVICFSQQFLNNQNESSL
jgi:hypothetical protein